MIQLGRSADDAPGGRFAEAAARLPGEPVGGLCRGGSSGNGESPGRGQFKGRGLSPLSEFGEVGEVSEVS
ncbi:hypothetical protein C6376_08935 [Streptomyces sp. P3]|nr:hypothetical protein C6376_08935 [Streptomyces sp. P3]